MDVFFRQWVDKPAAAACIPHTAPLPAVGFSGTVMRSTKDLATALLLLLLTVMGRAGLPSAAADLPQRTRWLLFVLALIWTDIASGLLHVVLDNPNLNSWPIIGPEARNFQAHRECATAFLSLPLPHEAFVAIADDDPSAIARGEWKHFLREHHFVCVAVGSTWLLRTSDSRLGLFLVHTGWMTHLMMASHRWSHTPPHRVPAPVQGLQAAGVLMSQEHHSAHHASYDINFAIFGGWVNPALNWATAHLLDSKVCPSQHEPGHEHSKSQGEAGLTGCAALLVRTSTGSGSSLDGSRSLSCSPTPGPTPRRSTAAEGCTTGCSTLSVATWRPATRCGWSTLPRPKAPAGRGQSGSGQPACCSRRRVRQRLAAGRMVARSAAVAGAEVDAGRQRWQCTCWRWVRRLERCPRGWCVAATKGNHPSKP